jgi:hypothetical protein
MKPIQRNSIQSTTLSEEQRFNALIEAIENRDVLLIVGRGFEVNKESEENKPQFQSLGNDSDLYDLILQHLKQECGSGAIDFSELNEDANFSYKDGNIWRRKNIYEAISETISAYDLTASDVNPKLKALLRTGYFRFVFTTSFSPLVEKAMQEQWGEENVRVLNVLEKNINKKDIIDSQRDLLTPTVYYLFGKAEGTNSFVVTDNDALNILQRWQSKMSGSKILEATSRKHLLALGCVQDDWLFRFIWYTLKGQNNLANGSVGRYAKSDSLERYLRRNNILEHKDAEAFIDKIIQTLKERKKKTALEKPHNGCDVFISYSRRDGDVADAVYSSLTKQGLDVWYDKYNLAGRGGEYMETIYHAIETCRLFVPILTPTISEQRADRHPYRLEWDCAVRELIKQKGIRCCIPVIDQEYDLYNNAYEDSIPDEIKKQDGFVFNRYSLDFDKWAIDVRNIISQ